MSPGVDKGCTTHSYACDCREEKFRKIEAENARLRVLLWDMTFYFAHDTREKGSERRILTTHGSPMLIRAFKELGWSDPKDFVDALNGEENE